MSLLKFLTVCSAALFVVCPCHGWLSSRRRNECLPLSKAKVIFIADGTSSVELFYTKGFIKEVVRSFPISEDNVRVGLIQFSESSEIEFDLDTYTSNREVDRAIDNMSHQRGRSTNTHLALEDAGIIFERARYLYSEPVPKVVVLITDGWSNYQQATISAASDLKSDMVTILAVGVGHANMNELKQVASGDDMVFEVDEFRELSDIIYDLFSNVCQESPSLPPQCEPECTGDFTCVVTSDQGILGSQCENIYSK